MLVFETGRQTWQIDQSIAGIVTLYIQQAPSVRETIRVAYQFGSVQMKTGLN